MSGQLKIPQSRILVDSNVYFRLAQFVHPLLGVEFGKKRYCLYIIDGFEYEYFNSTRLKTSFSWVQSEEYSENRTQSVNRSRAEKKEIDFNLEYLKETAREKELTTSPVDTEALVIALVLNIPVVTDDSDMLLLASEYEIKTMKTLELMDLMLQELHITDDKIDAITSYWDYSRDFPKDFLKDFKEIFKRPPKRD